MRIIQICDMVAYGDGVGNDILSKAELFQEMGYRSEIYGKHVDTRLVNKVGNIANLKLRASDILIHHYAGETDLVRYVEKQKCTKILMYHNVTPPELVEADMRKGCKRSLAQVKRLRGIYDYYVGVSKYNIECLKEMNVISSGEVLPIMVEFDKSRVNKKERRATTPIRFLFVGRIAGNKKHEDIINIFNYYNQNINPNSQLYLPGSHESSPKYYKKIKKLVESLPSKEKIFLPGKISDNVLVDLYNGADVYLSMSRHEGFGIPLLEAMSFRIPVFAYNEAAVEETLGSSGVLLDTNDPRTVAEKINETLSDENSIQEILAKQDAQLKLFEREAVKIRAKELLKQWEEKLAQKIEENLLYGDIDNAVIEESSFKIKEMEMYQCNYAYKDLYSNKKYIGKIIILFKKIVRKLLKWYIEPICFQQTEFNRATTESMDYISKKIEEIEDNENNIIRLLKKLEEKEVEVSQKEEEIYMLNEKMGSLIKNNRLNEKVKDHCIREE